MPPCRPPGPKDLLGDHPVVSLVLPAGFTRADGAKLYDVVARPSRCLLFAAGIITLWLGALMGDSFLIDFGRVDPRVGCENPADTDTACTAAAFGYWDIYRARWQPDWQTNSPLVPWTRAWLETKPYAVEALAKCEADPNCGGREAHSENMGVQGATCWSCRNRAKEFRNGFSPCDEPGFWAVNCNPLNKYDDDDDDPRRTDQPTRTDQLCRAATLDETTGKISGCGDDCARNQCSAVRTSYLYIKQTIVGAILGRFAAFVTGQTNYDTHVHSIGAGKGPRCCFVGPCCQSGCGPIMSLAPVVWLIAGTCTGIFCLLVLFQDIPELMINTLIQQLIAEYAVFAWIDTTAACLLGWHDVKKKIGNTPDDADEEAVTVSNPVDKDTTE